MARSIALFDFCGTLVSLQTADRFVYFVLQQSGRKVSRLMRCIISLAVAIRLLPPVVQKRWLLSHLKGLDRKQIQRLGRAFFEEVLFGKVRSSVLAELERYRGAGYEIAIVSGGYEEYLVPFAQAFAISHIIATRIRYEKGRCMGDFLGEDCMGENKVVRLRRELDLDTFDISQSPFYSDSDSDLPLFKLVGRPYFISTNKRLPKKLKELSQLRLIYE